MVQGLGSLKATGLEWEVCEDCGGRQWGFPPKECHAAPWWATVHFG